MIAADNIILAHSYIYTRTTNVFTYCIFDGSYSALCVCDFVAQAKIQMDNNKSNKMNWSHNPEWATVFIFMTLDVGPRAAETQSAHQALQSQGKTFIKSWRFSFYYVLGC